MTARIVRPAIALPVMALLALVGCGGANDDGDPSAAVDTGPTDDLAPSQRTAVTAPPPAVPPPCDPSAVSVWTAQVVVADGSADAVLRVRNDSDAQCEVDVSRSPFVDPLIEPDVWLEAGAWADLVVGADTGDCDDPGVVRRVTLDVNGASVEVDTAAVVPCGWQLTAFYPNSTGDVPCQELDVTTVPGAVLVRNAGVDACRVGSLVTVGGVELPSSPSEGLPSVPVLAAGDVVAFPTGDGAPPVGAVVLGFDSGATVEAVLDAAVLGGPPRPWIGGPGSPGAESRADLLVALDPFPT